MSAGPDPRTATAANAQVIEQERRRLSQRLDEVARLCESGMPAPMFYSELLQRLLESLAAVAGCVWLRTPQGNLQQQFQINMPQVGLDQSEEDKYRHDMLLRTAFTSGQNMHLPPMSQMGPPGEDGKPAPGNPTRHMLLMVPIKQNDQVIGLIEVFQGANRPSAAIQGFLQYMVLMADLAGRYHRNQLVSQLTGQQQLWNQLETFARMVHSSLNPTEVAFHVANEGRRLVDCDRISVAVRRGGQRTEVVAVSGSDVVEKRSNQVRLMRILCDEVLKWGERLVFTGTKDDSLPPKVLDALDHYLQESPSKMLVVMPLTDDREGDGKEKPKLPPRSVLLMECFETPAEPQQTIARLEVVAKHAGSSLFNALEYRRIPMRYLWMPLAKLQEGLGGATRFWTFAAITGIGLLIGALIALPYPLKMEATGQVMPQVRRVVYSNAPGQIKSYEVRGEEEVVEGRGLATMYDSNLFSKLNNLNVEMEGFARNAAEALAQANRPGVPPDQQAQLRGKAEIEKVKQAGKLREMQEYARRNNASLKVNEFGVFSLLSPKMAPEERQLVRRPVWTVLTRNYEDKLGAEVKPSEPIMRLGAKDGPWEIELKIPQKHIGQVMRGFDRLKTDTLDVDFTLKSNTTRLYKGKLDRHRIAGEAVPNQEDTSEPEPVVLAYVRIEDPEIEEGYQVDRRDLTSNVSVNAKIRCGSAAAGYSLFYGVWEFLYEKVVFFLF